MDQIKVTPVKSHSLDVSPGLKADAVKFWALLVECIVEYYAVIFTVAQFPSQGVFCVLDRDAFGRGGGVVLHSAFAIPYVGG